MLADAVAVAVEGGEADDRSGADFESHPGRDGQNSVNEDFPFPDRILQEGFLPPIKKGSTPGAGSLQQPEE